MKLRWLAVAPLLAAVLLVALIQLGGTGGTVDLLFRLEGTLVKALAAAGCVTASLALARGSRLRLAWAIQAVAYAVLAAKTLPVIGDHLLVVRLGTLAANALGPLSVFLLVRAQWDSGPARAIPPLQRTLLPLLALAGAIAVAGPSIAAQLEEMGRDPQAVLLVFSGIGDVAAITLLAPLLLVAVAMRGGRLAWPWALLAAGQLCWLLYDLASSFAPVLVAPAAARAATEVLRTAACLFFGTAGLAQRLALQLDSPERRAAA
jgi:hypothetical protein